ncbi:MAG: hypothetical protein NUV98_01080 [Candidatus Roizmanbacteria bacterium]|nr:hypothetical protein [Candidatus Roizmanbacteria bacterium]
MNLRNLVISVSNGLIKNERQASIVLVIISMIFFLLAIGMLINTFMTGFLPDTATSSVSIET